MQNRTNQFNLNQLRLDKSSISEYIKDEQIMALIYKDNRTDNQICASIVFCVEEPNQVQVLDMNLSCRFFARGLEYYLLKQLVNSTVANSLSIKITKSKKNKPAWLFVSSIADMPKYEEVQYNETVNAQVDCELLTLSYSKYVQYYQS